MDLDWNAVLADQLDWQWQHHLRPRVGAGDYLMEYAFPKPEIPPVTTIAWRLAHMIVGVFGARNTSHFGGPPAEYRTFAYAGTSVQAKAQLDEAYDAWHKGVRGLGAGGLARPCGPAEAPLDQSEALHHGAELALLRDIYRGQEA